jgi:acetylornithine deacetylase/succinyl-diaminopimelate desuccinylase-like protein
VATTGNAAGPSPEAGERVLARIDDGETVRLACDLIRIPSFTTEESACAEWLANYLAGQGLEVELQEIEPGRKQTIARLRGTGGGRSIMLNGHIDIDPLASGWTRDPFDPWIADGKLFGHGVYNMKAGVAACIMAGLAIQRSGVPIRGDVVLACVAAELNGGTGTLHAIEHGARTDMAVVAEPYGAYTILTKHTGSMDVVVHTLGRATHISKKEQGVDAIANMLRAIDALYAMRFTSTHDPDLPGLPRMNIGSIIGGRGRDHELRGLGRMAKAAVDVPKTEPVVQMVRRNLQRVAGRAPEHFGVRLPQSYAGNDTTHLWAAGIPCCLYGPGGGYTDYHDVHAYLEDLSVCARVLALTALEAVA